jgi:hypothetical protein
VELRGSFKPLLTDWEKGRVEEFDIDEKPLQKEISYDTVLEALESVEVRLCTKYAEIMLLLVRECASIRLVRFCLFLCVRARQRLRQSPPPPPLCVVAATLLLLGYT